MAGSCRATLYFNLFDAIALFQRQQTQEEGGGGGCAWLAAGTWVLLDEIGEGVGGSNAGSVFREQHGSQVERRVSDEARRGSRP